LLLAIPFIAVLWVPFYVSTSPELAGFPFFYWYQFLWVLISAILTAIVYFATESRSSRVEDRAAGRVREVRHD
jgi:hypothetical protein